MLSDGRASNYDLSYTYPLLENDAWYSLRRGANRFIFQLAPFYPFLTLPLTVQVTLIQTLEDFAKETIVRNKMMWSDIRELWNSKVAPKFTTEYFFEVILSAASTKLQEVKKTVSEKWDEIKGKKGIIIWQILIRRPSRFRRRLLVHGSQRRLYRSQ